MVKWYNWIFRYCIGASHGSYTSNIVCVHIYTIVRPEYGTWRFSCTILPYYSTALIISKNFHILSSFNVNEMGSHWVLFLLHLDTVLNWPEDGRLRPKHVAKYNLILIIASCLDVCCVLTVRNILCKREMLEIYKWILHEGHGTAYVR